MNGPLYRAECEPITKESQGRPWRCRVGAEGCARTAPCKSCLGRRNRRKGQTKQSRNLRQLEDLCDVQASWAGKRGNEETADHLPLRYENKAGRAGGANTIWTYYLRAETQSEAARAVGDPRPFVAMFSPDGTSEGLLVIRTSVLPAFVMACVESANRRD